ncbi:coiled-coil domain-containing protein 114 isoform X1 [Carassius carassius]|uniref:coiled-coil domain-containing protein 114 isoform X1 n=1 Tax=Carassius carassius TaxID=217509 RepID=UPI0028685CAA|nr:coiled-coil domain-containing protein 114 isoform X1 [Carassius carassius]
MSGGRSTTKAGFDSSLGESEETDLQRVHRLRLELRRLERNRELYLQEEETLRKQRQQIAELRAEQERLLQAQRESESPAVKAVRDLLKQRDKLDEETEKEKQTQAELQKEITIMEKKLAEMRRGQASHGHNSQPRDIQKAIRTTQSKLDRSRARFNEQMKINSRHRKDIETLHMQRTRFQQLYRKLEKVLQDIRKEIAEVVDKSATAYDAKVDAQTKTSMIKEKAVKDLAQYSAEMQELERVIAHEHQLKEFMSTKNNQRANMDNGKKNRRRQEMKEQRKADGGEETPESLRKAFQQIQELTGEDNLGKLVTKFIQGEERNFALFNYVNEQNAEAEKLREEIQQIRKDTEQLNIKSRQQEQESQVALKQVKAQLQESKAQTQQYEDQADHISKILDQFKTGIDSMFKKTDCSLGQMEGMLGSSSGITDSNLMMYLGLVEQKASELLTIQAFIKSKDPENSSDLKTVAPFLLGQKLDVQTHEASVQPPATRHDYEAEDSSLIDEAERPLTREELRQHIMRKSQDQLKEESLRAGGSREVKTPKCSTMSRTSLEA